MIHRRGTHLSGFSLVELLVSIAVVAILASLLIPAIGRARDSAHSVGCQANLRTLALAHSMYRQDQDGQSPPGFVDSDHHLSEGHKMYGLHLLRRYYKDGPDYVFTESPVTFLIEPVEHCPIAESTNTQSNASKPERGPDYGMLARDELYDTYYLNPSDTPLIWDGWNPVWNSSRRMPPRHQGGHGINVAFLDGRVEALGSDDERLHVTWWKFATTEPTPRDDLLGQGDDLISEERTY